MKLLNALAAFVLFLQLPIPVFWLILHPRVQFWRRHMRAGYWIACLVSWGGAAVLLIALRRELLASERAPLWAIVAGLALIVTDGFLLRHVGRDLGRARLIGHAEMKGVGELATGGIYSRMRHPRYTGMMISMLGVSLIAWTRLLWVVVAVWWFAALAAILFEERELRARFGVAYVEYARRVPRFLPFRLRMREE